jgi:hypothetical protein
MKSTIDMIEEAGLFVARENPRYYGASLDSLKAFEALVRADAIAGERNSWPAEMEAMERQVNILTDALAAQPAPVQEQVAAELERIAQEPPVNGNNLAQARVLMAAQRIRNATPPAAPTQDIPDLIAGALGVSRGAAYDLMREALKDAH